MRASVDIGTNTVLLLVAKLNNGSISVIEELQKAPRLGKGVDESRTLSEQSMQRVIAVLEDYKQHVNSRYPQIDKIIVTATSAVRDANNRSYFLDEIKERTGLSVQILSGLDEARYTYRGALSVLNRNTPSDKNVVLDIGGGSTEIALGAGDELEERHSFDMGCVRFTERYLKSDPVTVQQVENCRAAVRRELRQHPFSIDNSNIKLIGVAGTVTSLAFIDQGLDEYDAEKINGCILKLVQIQDYIQKFRKIQSVELKKRYPEVMKGRADIFMAGLLILEGFMDHYNMRSCTVSSGGVRHGAILESWKK